MQKYYITDTIYSGIKLMAENRESVEPSQNGVKDIRYTGDNSNI